MGIDLIARSRRCATVAAENVPRRQLQIVDDRGSPRASTLVEERLAAMAALLRKQPPGEAATADVWRRQRA